MNRMNIKNGILLSVISVILLCFLFSSILSEQITYWTIIVRLPTAFTFYGLFLLAFFKWFWKYRIFKEWLVLIPDLSGEWTGKLRTTYHDPTTGKKKKSIVINATIKQDLFNISINMRSREMKSTSFVAEFDVDKKQDRNRVCYSYTSRPKPQYREKSPIHDGTALLDIIGNPSSELKGEYWTTRKTTGTIELKRN